MQAQQLLFVTSGVIFTMFRTLASWGSNISHAAVCLFSQLNGYVNFTEKSCMGLIKGNWTRDMKVLVACGHGTIKLL